MRAVYSIFCVLFLISTYSCQQKELATLNIKKNSPIGWGEKEACDVIYTYGGSTLELNAEIKCRGGNSSRYDKHSYALELDESHTLSNLPSGKKWILNANYIDKTFMRHKISYDLFREMNSQNIAPLCSYINVSINDQYEGLYVLMQQINGSLLDLDKTDSMAMLFKEPAIFFREKLTKDYDSLNYYNQKFPKIKKADKTKYLEEFKDFLFNSNDEKFAQNINTWVDIDNVIDWHLLLLFSNNSDGIMKNFYLYKLNSETPFRFAIWDYDHSFGRDGDNELNMMDRILDCNRAILFERLSSNSSISYLPKLKKRWFELRNKNIFSEKNFEKHIELNHKLIKDQVGKNFEKWPLDNKWYYDNNNYEQELEIMRKYVHLRLENLDTYFNSL